MDLNQGLVDLVAVALVAALAPFVVAVLPGPRIPQVVIFLLGGVLIGPHVLGVAETSSIQLLANIGLGFLFLLAGYELDPALLRQQAGRLAIGGWLISAGIAVGVAAGLTAAGYIRDYVPVGLALTTTALGTLLPILRDNDMLSGPFGQYVYAAGAAGELFPILIIAVFMDLKAISQDPLRLLIFLALLLIVRGLPSLLIYRHTLAPRQRAEMTFITATTLPLLIALAEFGQRDRVMLPDTAAAMIGAGVLSVLVYPLIAVGLHRSAPLTPADVGITVVPTATGTSTPPENPGQHDQGSQSP